VRVCKSAFNAGEMVAALLYHWKKSLNKSKDNNYLLYRVFFEFVLVFQRKLGTLPTDCRCSMYKDA
jgi:hypothetical protein